VETARLLACEKCGAPFLVCGWLNRRYCGPDCAQAGEKARHRRARKKYRQTPEGREQHRAEEQRRRARGQGVGDRFVQAPATAAKVAEMESAIEPDRRGLVRWRVMVTAALAAVAESWRASGEVVTCVDCGRRGRVVEVVVWGRRGGDDGA
jgi:hypothetical protein